MITVSTAVQLIQEQTPQIDCEELGFKHLDGRVLAEDILAKRPQPPFDRVTMDGIAINSDDWKAMQPEFTLQATQFAGEAAITLKAGFCIEIMTGAVVPLNADCVIPIEQLDKTETGYRIKDAFNSRKHVAPGSNIHYQGSDHLENAVLIPVNTKLKASHIACLVSAGYAQAKVKIQPKIAVVMTGDELVKAGEPIKDHQIYASNGTALTSLLKMHHYTRVNEFILGDDAKVLTTALQAILKQHDFVITTGGVSMGQKDQLPQVFKDLGVTCHFHTVAQKPGKPMWYGTHNKTQVFGLPGNPVSAMITARRYILTALDNVNGLKRRTQMVRLSEDINFKPALTYFLPVKILYDQEARYAEPVAFNTSGDTVSLTRSDGFVELDANTVQFNAGDIVRFFPW
ncbi:MAG: molybdopterin molybdotransferase MoeA [Gammaproteobacteria bacterium]|nr:molybdopterin molybdotransferase MoeA [Gammaproteobacteria bacterium]NNC98365.1 molybdopterin molybdotransferase MoeA [Gammaproteobacteria bacterium]